jgi:hypothetical protein
MRQVRRIDLLWQGDEVSQYERLKKDAKAAGQQIPRFVKKLVEKVLK